MTKVTTSREGVNIFLIIPHKHMLWVLIRKDKDNLHEVSDPISYENKKNIINLSSVESW